MGAGVVMALGGEVPYFGRGLASGIWLILIGWFLNYAARTSYQQLKFQRELEEVPVREVMREKVQSVPPNLTVAELLRDLVIWSDQRAFPVVRGEELIGLVYADDAVKVSRDRWSDVRVEEIMVPIDRLRVLGADEQASTALQQLAEQDPIPMVDRTHLVGMARRDDLMRWLAWHTH